MNLVNPQLNIIRLHVRFLAAFTLLWLVVPENFTNAQTVSVWLTTSNQSVKLQQQPSVAFTTTSGGTNPIFVDERQTYQQIEGFGASFTDSAGYVLNEVATPLARSNVMNRLFTRTGGGIGLSFVRNPMGASDLTRFDYSYDDQPAGSTDTNLTFFSIAHDQADIIPLVQQALQLNPQLKIMANPWSPPGWMKSSGSMITGSLLTNMYTAFANYFVRYIQAYEAAGIPIHYISLQNEPLYQPPDYPGMSMDAPTQLTVLRDFVLPALAANNLTNRVLVYDHNWDRPDFPQTVLADSSVANSAQVAGIAWHGYGGTPGVMLTSAARYPTKGNFVTEHTGYAGNASQVVNDFTEIIHVMRSWGKTFVKWNLAGDQYNGPHTGGCTVCSPLVTVNTNSGAISYTIDFYTLGHFSKFVLPGALRIFSGNGPGVVSAAFLNPDGSKALVAFNDTTNSTTFQVQWGTQSFEYSLPSFAGATFTWAGTQTGGYSVNPSNQIPASSFNFVHGLQTEPTSDTLGGYDLGYANNGYYALYENVDFGAGFTNVSARVASAGSGGTLEFHVDSLTGPRIGLVTIPVTGGWQTWQTVSGPVSAVSGLHNLFVVFKGTTSIGNLNWFQFTGALPLNHPPVLAPIPDQSILGGRILTITNSATDPDVPPQVLSFSLLSAPIGASIDTNSGLFTWRPSILQSPSVQTVAVAVSDNGSPPLSATQTFQVTVSRPVMPTLSLASVTNNQFGFWINGDAGPDYTIQASTNLVSWSPISISNSPTLPYSWADTNSVLFPFRFYRVILGP